MSYKCTTTETPCTADDEQGDGDDDDNDDGNQGLCLSWTQEDNIILV